MRIGVVGLGNMGVAFAAKALSTGHEVTVWNRTPGRAAALVEQGAVEAPSAADAARDTDCVLLLLSDDRAVLDVCLGGGLLAALGPNTVLVNVSTIAPATARRIAEAGPVGRVLDSPVAGSPATITAGQGKFFVGGPIATITGLDPLWTDLAVGYVHCGEVGAGSTVKIAVNFLLITGTAALAEAITMARRNGVADDLLRGILDSSPAVSAGGRSRLDGIMSAEHQGWFSPVLARKDLRLALALAEQGGVDVRVGPAVDELLTTVVDSGVEWSDFSAVIEAL